MSQKTTQKLFLASIALGLLTLLFFILKPYFAVIFISAVFAITFYPLYQKLTQKFNDRPKLAAAMTTFLILIFVVIPLTILSALLLKEATGLYNTLVLGGGSQNFVSQINILIEKANAFLPTSLVADQASLESYISNLLNWIISHFDSISVAILGGILNFILMIIALYYFFIYGDRIKKGLMFWSPLPDEHDEEFIETLKSSVDAVLRGRILISIVQGALIGVGFFIFGIGSPVLWGFVGGIASLVPVLGTSVVTVPAVAYLFLSGHTAFGVGLLIWTVLLVGLVDNFLSVILLKNKIKVHPLVVLFSILGGVELFGMIGFLVGPVVVSSFMALMKIYPFVMSYKNE
ncbi:MAG: AI-2E family transporter [Candidatus Paceibacterota bacterium]|jgi:predicted PurR-regulated permease PerM